MNKWDELDRLSEMTLQAFKNTYMKHFHINDTKKRLAAEMYNSAGLIEEMEATIKKKIGEILSATTSYVRQGELSKEVKSIRERINEETRRYNRLKDQHDLIPDEKTN